MKILIYGGSFDPVHKGHCALLKAAINQIKPDYTHIFTAWQSPFKQKSPVPFETRQNMAREALGPISPAIIFDDFEKRARRVVYTWETVKRAKELYKGSKVYLLVGADCLNDMHKWKNAPYLFQNAVITAGARKGFEFGTNDFDFTPLKGGFPLVSSTQLRLAIMCNGMVPTAVPAVTAAFIEKNLMYGLNMHKWLEANLKPRRYLHTKMVAQTAAALAHVYSRADAERAATAALLHDMAKCMGDNDLIEYCRENGLKIKGFDEIRRRAPHLLHGAVSADMAKKLFGIKDKDLLLAISRHTLGAADMSVLQKIIFTADMASKDRKYKEARAVQAAAQKSLDEGMLAAMAVKLNFTIQTRKWLAPAGPELWNKLISKLN
ncbi:MAG: bis(5'-nucleosyl)-tetraphosphatase (symmetrical) YqeK [Elusimicrobiota bacterium]|jgi:nicotinate-nucleotide adenylyltransferase|nr:bis(5'-nucleosyl)-tetraphosphatase (symmetrical) YqeK [Elusimicrobiota bacterium]